MIKPFGDRVLVLQKKKEVGSGIIVTDEAEVKYPIGTVVAVSDHVTGISVGNEVIFTAYAGERVEEDGKEYLLVKTNEIIAIKSHV